ncbi:2-C-methyl-D-erythritol 4-phosphate cytidylyltransferase [Fictibacillus macauensis ZFHKF-1]|uniref:2-C-methyl-D-erythritol 4-phosphate cytidylyltransferase n=1 Tax=Fictibacillus macauensis ZFHKF-1 TaxID=1196324 RepID=I8AER3_9BACL|nr:2-C-methyl-D-erythritol 4-phosphate cytidylyltransferase [Fictibacillus macauensis]EIT84082.1 2-C-methyl-D-erythritol 4-phosphate cytidylyltransferase [Fictibacillus macauensis ZFHKF-1]
MNYTVVIPAAGQGKRMNAGKNKQWIELDGKPLIAHTMTVFEEDPWCEKMILSINEKEQSLFQELVSKGRFQKQVQLVAGGAERQHSVHEGLKAASDAELVLIHDGARPFVEQERIHELVKKAMETGAAILAVPLKDTVKKGSNGIVDETVDRASLWAVQTPQAFRLPIVLDAHETAAKRKDLGTDDASLVENMGHPVSIVEGDYTNIKLTTVHDILFAKAILAERKRK